MIRENMYRALCCGSCLCYVWPNMRSAYMDSWLAWALIGGNVEWLEKWKEAQGFIKVRQSKGLSVIQDDRRQSDAGEI